ncbi:hypothetical protein GCM10010244_12300 [Streptomyces coeruleorubidus]|nr:hypothetical protein GCM10010244_12300 [Streptomyces bellus]
MAGWTGDVRVHRGVTPLLCDSLRLFGKGKAVRIAILPRPKGRHCIMATVEIAKLVLEFVKVLVWP